MDGWMDGWMDGRMDGWGFTAFTGSGCQQMREEEDIYISETIFKWRHHKILNILPSKKHKSITFICIN